MFKDLLQVAIGRADALPRTPLLSEWKEIYRECRKQKIQGIMFDAIRKLPPEQRPPEKIYEEWAKLSQTIAIMYDLHKAEGEKVIKKLDKLGIPCSIIKGINVARYYPNPAARICGDIDVWVNGGHRRVIHKLRDRGYNVTEVLYQECKVDFLPSINVEVHFRPTKMFNPHYNRKLQNFYSQNSRVQINDAHAVYRCFDAVFLLAHMFRHAVEGGIGLRQMTDYYFLLMKMDDGERRWAWNQLKDLGLKRFAAETMYVMQRMYSLEDQRLLCPPDAKNGAKLLAEIQRGGNFGEGEHHHHHTHRSRMRKALHRLRRIMHFFSRYPEEIFWAPGYKLWHYFWRLRRGYLQ